MGEIGIVKQMNEVLSVQLVAKKPRQSSFEPRSITVTKGDLVRVQPPTTIPWSSKCEFIVIKSNKFS